MASYFANLGGLLFDADIESKKILLGSSDARDEIVALVGTGALNRAGEIDTTALAKLIFADEKLQQALNGILHPRVTKLAREQMEQALLEGVDLFILDAPLLFEAGLQQHLDKTILVTADESLRVRRAVERGGLSEDDIRKRMALQMGDDEKRRLADVVIENNGSMAELTGKLDTVYKSLLASR